MSDIQIQRSSIMHASGKPMVMLGGDVWDQRKKGDLIVEFKWVSGEPVMLLYKNTLGNNSPAFMIEFADAYKFARSDGNATKELMSTFAHEAAKALNSEHDKATVYRIITAIMENIGDLLMMPPEPKAHEIANRPSSGHDELSVKVNGQVVMETIV
jgi:hypothetical protein